MSDAWIGGVVGGILPVAIVAAFIIYREWKRPPSPHDGLF